MLHISTVWLLRPAFLALQDVVGIAVDGRMALLHVEPPGITPFQRCVQWHSKVLAHHSITQLKIHSADHLGIVAALLLQPEHVSEEVEVWKNPQIRFTEVDKDRDVQDGVWMEIAQTKCLELQ